LKAHNNFILLCLVCLQLSAAAVSGQDYGDRLGVQRGGKVSFEPQGSGVMFGALDPAVKKWYVPQELATEYGWRQWEYSNYARDPYQRYVSTTLEGDYFYDFYGNFIGRGWLIYDWRQDQPQQLGSSIFQNSRFSSWFNSVTIGGESKGQYHYAITVGDRIRTTLTPMTFSKPTFNGVQIDFASDKYAATILASRISEPIRGATNQPITRTNATSLFGGRATFQLGDFIELGATLVNARNSNTSLDLFSGDMIAGTLTSGQSSTPLTAIAIVLSDDSPADGEGGAALFSHDVRITSKNFETGREEVFTLQQVVRAGAEWPIIFGGFQRSGFLAADGPERIVLNYDFDDPSYIGPDPTSITNVEFDYVMANDFKVEMWSSQQTGQRPMPSAPLSPESIDSSEPAFMTVQRADGNVQDISNLQRVRFEYGLPTGNLVGGFSIEGTDVLGFDFYGEWDRNKKYFQYPNAATFTAGKQHEISSLDADAWHFNLSKKAYPYYLFGEAYSFDRAYSTTAYLADSNGDVQYDNTQRYLYEFVEDNDDLDRFPDWTRFGQLDDRLIFPGWDQNNDFINDFNQNDNATVTNILPDYEEPFLRFEVDRPEFLFGIDHNNNNWIDRFEDDDLPDYPYKADRRGYNFYVGAFVTPHVKLSVGRTDEDMISVNRSNRTNFLLFTLDRDYPGLGRLQIFESLKRSKDTIPDDRREPTPFVEATGIQPLVRDILPAQDTWINSSFIGFDYRGIENLRVDNKVKWEVFNQATSGMRDIDNRPLRDNSSFFGAINKIDYLYEFGRLSLRPRFKSEYLRKTPFLRSEEKRRQWTGTGILLAQMPALQNTLLQAGVELLWLHDLVADEEEMVDLGITRETGDINARTVAVQLSNMSNYQGYVLTTQIGLRFSRILTEGVTENAAGGFDIGNEASSVTTSFLTVYAGLQ
jgi:hypothetical protein